MIESRTILQEILDRANRSKRKRTEVRVFTLVKLLDLVGTSPMAQEIKAILTRAENSKRKRTEVRAYKLEFLLTLVKPKPEPVPGDCLGNRCECGNVVLTPSQKFYIQDMYGDDKRSMSIPYWTKKDNEHYFIYSKPTEPGWKEAPLMKDEVHWTDISPAPNHKVWKTLSRNYCENCLDHNFHKTCVPKFIDKGMSEVFKAHKDALKTLGYEAVTANLKGKITLKNYTPRLRISHRGGNYYGGIHGLYTHSGVGIITLYVKKSRNMTSLYQTFIHEMTHHFMRWTGLDKNDTHKNHGRIFKSLLKEATKILGYEYNGNDNIRFVAEMSPKKTDCMFCLLDSADPRIEIGNNQFDADLRLSWIVARMYHERNNIKGMCK